jgi:FtsH-binding integral membrane protein
MSRALFALLLALSASGCVTTASIVRRDDVKLPLLVGAIAADLVVTSVVASQVRALSVGGSIATGLAVTAVDVGVGCLLGGCAALRP